MTDEERLERHIEKLENQLYRLQLKADRQAMRAAWYRTKLLRFVTNKWIEQEKEKDGFQDRR